MAATLPVPIKFRLPEGWQAADPDELGAPETAFAALHPGSRQPGSIANITIDGHHRPDPATLADIAEESVRDIERVSETVSVTRRSELGSQDVPGFGQVLRFSAVVEGVPRELFQCQIYLAMTDAEEPQRRVVLRLVLTANRQQFTELVDDFQEFVGTVRPQEVPGTE